MFKNFICIAFALLLTACLEDTNVTSNDKLKAVTSFTILADMARNVAGDAAIVESITKPGAEIHDYQPTPKDITRAQNADLILWNGLNLERWFKRFFQDTKNAKHIITSEGVKPISIYDGPYSGKPNPHAWMSISDALIYVENIRKAFAEADPENASIYNQNAAAYSKQLKELQAELKSQIPSTDNTQKTLVTSEGAFSYLARDLNMKELFIWPINADQQGNPQQIKNVIDNIRANNIPVIFSESTISPKPAQQIASEAGIHYGGVLYVDSLSAAGGPVPTYMDLIKTTTQTIAQGFKDADNKE